MMLEKIEAKLVPPERKWLRAIIHEGDAEAVVKEKQEKALAEHVRHAISAFNVFHRYRLRVTRASFVPSGVAARPDPGGDGAR
jgi:hypothetical protein